MHRDQIRDGISLVIAKQLGVGSMTACQREADAVLDWLDQAGLTIVPVGMPGAERLGKAEAAGPAAKWVRPRERR